MTPAPLSPRTARRSAGIVAVAAVVAAGLVAIAPPLAAPAAAAVPLPSGAERFAVSRTAAGESTEPYLTPDGQRVFFTSTASDLVADDDNGVADVFRSVAASGSDDPFSGAPVIVSVPDDALGTTQANGASGDAVASADGRYVAFASAATNLVAAGGTPGRSSIYVRDTVRGTTFRVEAPAGEPDGRSYDPDLDDSGRYLVFTSEATNLSAGDTNGAADSFWADLDANGDGVHGDVAVSRFLPSQSIPGGTEQARISGNADTVVFTAHLDDLDPAAPAPFPGDHVYRGGGNVGVENAALVQRDASHATVDSTGTTFAFIDESTCDALPSVVVATLDNNLYSVALGTIGTDRRVGYVADPEIAADGSHVVWTTTVPAFDFATPAVELTQPVVREQEIDWRDAKQQLECVATFSTDWIDLADGVAPSLSASGRTVAFTAPAPAAASVFAIDTHSHDGLAVSSTQGQLVTPGFMTVIDIGTIPLSTLRGYASAVANAPMHRLPMHRLPMHRLPMHRLPIHRLLVEDSPMHRLPMHRLPIHRLPMHRLDLPGGWAQVLADTPFAGELIQSVTLDEVLTWAAAALATGSSATEAERAAATVIQSLTLGDLSIDDSGLDALTLASYVLGSAPLAEVPIAGDGEPLERWQDIADAQGLGLTVEPDMFLADLDAVGLDIERSGIDAVPLRSLPVAATLMDELRMNELFLAGTPLGGVEVASLDASARVALFGTADVAGTLATPTVWYLDDASAADLAPGAPESVTLGTLFLSMLDAATYPWEQIAASSIDPNLAESATGPTGCDVVLRCGQNATFLYTFDPGPGEPSTFTAPTATLTTPAGTATYLQWASASGPGGVSISGQTPFQGPKQVEGGTMRIPLADTPGGTVLSVEAWYTATTLPGESQATGELSSGGLAGRATLYGDAPLDTFDDPAHNLYDGQWEAPPAAMIESQVYYEWLSPGWRDLDDSGDLVEGPAQDEDYFLVNPAPAGKRLVISTNAMDGQIALALYAPKSPDSTLGLEGAGPAPGTPVTEQSGPGGQPAESGADAGVQLQDQILIDQAVVSGDGTAQIEAASTDAAPGDQLLVRVTSGNGTPSAALYSLRVQYVDEAPEVHCTPWKAAVTDDPGVEGVSDPVTDTTNTIFLFDAKRYGDTYGAAAADEVRDALVSLTGDGHVGTGPVDGAVLAIDSSPGVVAARAALDANPCSMTARAALTSAINAFVADAIDGHRSQISSVVIVGGDDIVPLAPVAQHTSQFTEESHAADLRLTSFEGEPCPVGITPGIGVDPCETPLSAAASTSHILTDDPYGLATAYDSLGGHLYVPTVGLGRLAEGPEGTLATIDRFLQSDGILDADSSLTGGYGAWSELPEEVTESLAWRSATNQQFSDVWTASDIESRLFPDAAESPRVVSINTHADETRMLPGVPGAESGDFADGDLFLAAGHEDAAQLAGALIFGIGCHAGNNLPAGYYGDVTDWVDVFSQAGGYIGNTGYGLANSVTTALGERLLALYSDWIGVSLHGDAVSAASALTYAKQSYLGGLGLYSGYDEKVLMEAVYYGLPMYTFAAPAKTEMPLPETPDLTVSDVDGLMTASLSFSPEFHENTTPDAEYLTVDGEAPVAVPGQPILPSIVRTLEPAPPGLAPRGVILTALTSVIDRTGTPAVATPSVGIPETTATRTNVAFPSTFGTITQQQTPLGPVDLLVMTPARVEQPAAGQGFTERFTDFTAQVVYGDASSTDTAPPVIASIELPGPGGGTMYVQASDIESDIASVIVLVQPEGQTEWQRADVTPPAEEFGTEWSATVPTTPFRWMVQVVDAAGNVATETSRGRLGVAGAAAPTLGDAGPDTTVDVGARVLRAVPVTDGVAGEGLTASVRLTAADGELVATSAATVETGADGTTRALIDQVVPRYGAFTATLTVCRGSACTDASFQIDTPAPNSAPTATVVLTADANPVEPSSILTAHATATDPDGGPVTASYAWSRNGLPLAGATGSTLALAGIAQTGDVIRVTVTPDDDMTPGHAAFDEIVVGREVTPPAAPTITAMATTSAGAYVEGAWSISAVTVSFACTHGAPLLLPCPAPQVIATDTTAAGTTVTGTVTDLIGRTATATVLVRLDATAPTLTPAVTPAKVEVGAPATATPNATDAASGVASQSCDVPQTATAGAASVTCRATDVAGNTTVVQAHYTVVATPDPEPEPQPEPTPTPTPPTATPTPPGSTPPATRPPSTRRSTGGPGGSGGSGGGIAAPVLPGAGTLPDRQALGPVETDGSSVYSHGSAVPVIFRALDDDGEAIGTPGFVREIVLVTSQDLAAGAAVNEAYFLPFPFVYADAADVWLGTIPTADLDPGVKYTYRVDLADGTSFTLTFGVSG
ncbi:hypothetical protein [Microbacterium sp. SS28]|uniref:hypothetical protein n=1 Tax=Microbacterium sp. SS28 TaxID=2919948 RepID=UPI001FA98CCF|nr:hypothetical protein [Microbacterium sp. SS28]